MSSDEPWRDLVEVERDGSLVLTVHVQPGARRSGVVGRHGDALKLRVTAPPVSGKANHAAVALLAELLQAKPSQVELVSGATSRHKRFRLTGLDVDHVARCLGPLLRS